MIIDPKEQSITDNYKLLIGSILPRPIAFISTISENGIANLAPFSFFSGISSKPPMICFAPARRTTDGSKKDTLINIEKTGEFVLNIVTEEIVLQMNDTATDFPPGINEFEKAGLTPVAAEIVKPSLVKESPVNMECILHKIVEVGPDGPGGGALVIGEVLLFHIADHLFENGRMNTTLLNPVGRLAGKEYTTLGRRFMLERKPYVPEK